MNFEFAFKTLWGVATAAGWFWINGLSAKLRAAEQERTALRERIHDIELNYQSKNDTKELRREILEGLAEIKSSLHAARPNPRRLQKNRACERCGGGRFVGRGGVGHHCAYQSQNRGVAMAYPVEMQKQLRDLYVLRYLSLEEAAKELGISFATARAWKAKAQKNGTDWDVERAAQIRVDGKDNQLTNVVFLKMMALLERNIDRLSHDEDIEPLELGKALIGLGDTLSKTTALGARIMPEVNRVELVMRMVRLIGDTVREERPDIAPYFVELLERLAPDLAQI